METREMIIRGKTVEEALRTAVKTFRVDESQIQIEVLDEGQKGVFGFLERPAVMRAVVLPPEEVTCQEPDSEPNHDGTVRVKDGAIEVHNPLGDGKPATIIPTPEAVLRINGVTIHDSSPVWEDDEIDIQLAEEVYSARTEVEVSDDYLTAYVKVTPQITLRNELLDQDAENTLQLLTQCHEEQINTLTPAEIERALKDKGVVFGLDYDRIRQVATEADGVSNIVARGEPVQQGKDGYVEYLFELDPVKIVYDDDEKVDHWERYVFPSVKEGDVLAVLHPAIPGIPGTKVTGEAIPPDRVREDVLRVKDGVRISGDRQQAIATIAGRPVIEGQSTKYLKVTPLMVHTGDVDMASGNLRFLGDLLIVGNVTEGMHVSTLGDITVRGNVTGASILAGSRIVCQGNVIKSQLQAGGMTSLCNRLKPLVDDLGRLLEEVIQEVAVIQEHLDIERQSKGQAKGNNIDRIVCLLIERKRISIQTLLREYSSTLSTTHLPTPPAINELMESVKNLVAGLTGRGDSSLDALASAMEKRQEVCQVLDSLLSRPDDIICNYVQNSVLETTGSIIVTDKGGFYSILKAERDVSVRGVFRGGEMSAQGNVFAHEVGSPGPSSGEVKIKVTEGSVIKLRKVFPETTVQVGNRTHYFKKEENSLRISLDSENNLWFDTFSV